MDTGFLPGAGYARNVEAIHVTGEDGKVLTFAKSRKNQWRVETGGANVIRFAYRIYCREMSVRTNWVEDGFALLNGAATFVTLVGSLDRPHEVTLQLPAAWKTSITGLEEAPGGPGHRYLAANYDALWSIRLFSPATRPFTGLTSTAFRTIS